MKKNSLFPLFDTAYQGFASGDLEYDAWAVRYFIEQGFQMIITQSFAKNMGLYGERVGALHIVCTDKPTAEKVKSQLLLLVRMVYLNPPLHGARLASGILNSQENMEEWKAQLKIVSGRIKDARVLLRQHL